MKIHELEAEVKRLAELNSDLAFFISEEFVENAGAAERELMMTLMNHNAETSRHLAIMRGSLERYMRDGAM